MFEVLMIGNRWTWRLICAAGRILVYTAETFETDHEAAEAAKAYRRGFWFVADQIDHRMARCI
jgi:hypothetical protein